MSAGWHGRCLFRVPDMAGCWASSGNSATYRQARRTPAALVAFEHREISHCVAVMLPLLVENHVKAFQDAALTIRMTR